MDNDGASLTRNLYRLEEVRAAFIYGMIFGRMKEATFWAQELCASDLSYVLSELLYHCWIWYACPHDIELLAEIRYIPTNEDELDKNTIGIIFRLREAINKSKGETTVLQIMVRGLLTHPSGKATKWPTSDEYANAEKRASKCGISADICHVICQAARKGNVARVWYYLSRKSSDSICRFLPLLIRDRNNNKEIMIAVKNLVEFSCASEGANKLSSLAAASILVSSRKAQRKLIVKRSIIDDVAIRNTHASLEGWIKRQGKRIGRIFDIPHSALYAITLRGKNRNDFSTLENLHDIVTSLKQGTPFWKWILANYNLNKDDAKQDFFDTWFPDDIPDEWGLADKNKSHGDCLLQEGEVIDARKYLHIYFRNFRLSKYVGVFRFHQEKNEDLLDFTEAYKRVRTVEPLMF
jgi:hypothetical protein